jgi:ABC-type multidrug transport system permease subunit
MAFSWAMLYLALAWRTAEATQAARQTLMFLLTFLSSVSVPLATTPGWLQAIAHANPVTCAVDALRIGAACHDRGPRPGAGGLDLAGGSPAAGH